MSELTFHDVSNLLLYDRNTGRLFWKPRTAYMFGDGRHSADHTCAKWNARFAGMEAFTSKTNGYLRGGIDGRIYKAHRVIWAIVTGQWPADQIDHINGVPTDNRIENLREVSRLENCKNRKLPSSNKSGVIGVSLCRVSGKRKVGIRVAGKRKHIGLFDRFSDAVEARKSEEAANGFHENHGRAARAFIEKEKSNG